LTSAYYYGTISIYNGTWGKIKMYEFKSKCGMVIRRKKPQGKCPRCGEYFAPTPEQFKVWHEQKTMWKQFMSIKEFSEILMRYGATQKQIDMEISKRRIK
jgi:threonine synthase